MATSEHKNCYCNLATIATTKEKNKILVQSTGKEKLSLYLAASHLLEKDAADLDKGYHGHRSEGQHGGEEGGAVTFSSNALKGQQHLLGKSKTMKCLSTDEEMTRKA